MDDLNDELGRLCREVCEAGYVHRVAARKHREASEARDAAVALVRGLVRMSNSLRAVHVPSAPVAGTYVEIWGQSLLPHNDSSPGSWTIPRVVWKIVPARRGR